MNIDNSTCLALVSIKMTFGRAIWAMHFISFTLQGKQSPCSKWREFIRQLILSDTHSASDFLLEFAGETSEAQAVVDVDTHSLPQH